MMNVNDLERIAREQIQMGDGNDLTNEDWLEMENIDINVIDAITKFAMLNVVQNIDEDFTIDQLFQAQMLDGFKMGWECGKQYGQKADVSRIG